MAIIPKTSNYNLLTSPKWIAFLPVKTIDPDYNSKNIAFNLTNFNLSPISIAFNQTGFQGYQVPLPAHVRDQDKTITFNYLPDTSLSQYQFLYKWLSKISIEDGSGLSENVENLRDIYTNIRVILLSEFKNAVMEIIFEGSFLQEIGSLIFDYQDTSASPIRHSFTIKYQKISFDMDPTI